jgi:ferric-dicitrate binding protein FerR (iron transport regulator)
MKSTSPLDVLREMRRVVAPVPGAEEEQARRERIAARVVELSRELRVEQRRRLRVRVLLAALVSIGLGVVLLQWGPGSRPPQNASARVVSGRMALLEGDHSRPWTEATLDLEQEPVLQTGAAEEVALELPSRAALEVSAASELALVRHAAAGGWSERINLRTGGVKLRVPKLGNNQHLAVETADARVEVRGTRFEVRVEHDARGAFTRVDVDEGRVAVRSERGPSLLGPGEHWTSREPVAAAPPLPSAAPVPSAAPSEPERQPPARASKSPVAASEPTPDVASETSPSVLAEQNRLFQAAALAKRSGLPKLALERLETLLETYPSSELAQNARVEHFRLLRDTGQSERARESARLYLERYPGGFAAAEAQRVLEGAVEPP